MLVSRILAEEVETSEQLLFLQDKGCAVYHRYLMSKSVKSDAFVKLLYTQ